MNLKKKSNEYLGILTMMAALQEAYLNEYKEFCEDFLPEHVGLLNQEISLIIYAHKQLIKKVAPVINQKNNINFMKEFELFKIVLDRKFKINK